MNKSTWVRAAALAVLLFSLVPGTGRAHRLGADPSQIPLTLRPSDAQGNPIAGPGYFDFNAASGTTTSLYAIVGNEGVQKELKLDSGQVEKANAAIQQVREKHMDEFAKGIVDSRRLIYYLSATLFFLFLTSRALEDRKWR